MRAWLPPQPRCQLVPTQITIDRVVAQPVLRMVRVVRGGVIVQSRRAFRRHARQFTDFSPALGLRHFRKHQLFV